MFLAGFQPHLLPPWSPTWALRAAAGLGRAPGRKKRNVSRHGLPGEQGASARQIPLQFFHSLPFSCLDSLLFNIRLLRTQAQRTGIIGVAKQTIQYMLPHACYPNSTAQMPLTVAQGFLWPKEFSLLVSLLSGLLQAILPPQVMREES